MPKYTFKADLILEVETEVEADNFGAAMKKAIKRARHDMYYMLSKDVSLPTIRWECRELNHPQNIQWVKPE